ncbi:MAG: four helix bundle protein [Verrucomicrobiales bacterium]|nr:four helix bundle protein [Verrucomicrobiales bacterium]
MPTNRPPIYTALVDLVGWTLDRTAALPRSHRFTFGERVDRLTLDCLEYVIEAIHSPPPTKQAPLRRLNLALEKLRVFWRLISERGWISERQLLFVSGRLDEIGRMTGGWLKQVEKSRS